MTEPRRLLEGARSPLARQLLEAGLNERPKPSLGARIWRECAGVGLAPASTFGGSARSFATTFSKATHLVVLPGWMRRAVVFAGAAALAGAAGFSLWFSYGRPAPAPSHFAEQPFRTDRDERALLDHSEALLTRGKIADARKELARYRLRFPDGSASLRAESLERRLKDLEGANSMDTP
jgi:hypothetical protein